MAEQDLGVKWFNAIYYPAHRTARAAGYESGVLPRLREEEVIFFTPWGPRYSLETRGVAIQAGDKEVEVLRLFADFLAEMEKNMPGKKFLWVFLGADLYGTAINGLPEETVSDYFASLAQWLAQILPLAEFWLWSSLSQEAELFRGQVRERFEDLVSPSTLARAVQTARAMGRGGNPRAYLVERLAEAALIEQKLRPIKLSAVGRHKDDGVDGPLPRLYFVPEQLQAPWL